MTKTILWDFDGVILDSMKIKGNGFRELFKEYDEKYLDLIEDYHYRNGGVSRFEKIRYFYEDILNKNILDDKVENLAKKFATIITENLFDSHNLILDSIEFIEKNHKNYNFHIVSGAEDKELNELCQYFKLDRYFISINGSPTKKSVLVKNTLEKYGYKKNETILIGDAITDYNASVDNAISFYGYNNISLKQYDNYISTFKDFSL